MGDRDERLGPSTFPFSPQRRRAVLRHDPVRERAWVRHGRARLQRRDDPRDGAVAPRRRQRDDRRAAARARGPEDEIELAADPGDLTRPRLSAVTCPVRSISSAELIATKRSSCATVSGS